MKQPTSRVRERIAILASDLCKEPGDKDWMHVREFVADYREQLKCHDICATDGTADIISGETIGIDIRRLGPTTRGVTHLAALVALGQIDRVLFFTDPKDQQVYRPENDALLRNCAIHDVRFCVNQTAYLWAYYAKENKVAHINDRPPIEQTLALIADDAKKPDLLMFVQRHAECLKRFSRVIATEGTRKYLSEGLQRTSPRPLRIQPATVTEDGSARVTPSQAAALQVDESAEVRRGGPQGGDVIVAHEAYGGRCNHIVFFFDPDRAYAHLPDILVLLRAAVHPESRVNLMLNWSTADEWAGRIPLVRENHQ